MYGQLAGAGNGTRNRNGSATSPAPATIAAVSSSTSLPPLIIAFQLACSNAASRTAKETSRLTACLARRAPVDPSANACREATRNAGTLQRRDAIAFGAIARARSSDHGIGRRVAETQGLRDRLVRDLAGGDVEARLQVRIVVQRLTPAL